MQALAGTADPSLAGKRTVATIRVPDERIDRLSLVFRPKKTTYATVEVVLDDTSTDTVARRVAPGKTADVIVLVASAFGLGAEGAEAALADLEKMLTEMVLMDQAVIEKRLETFRKTNDKGIERQILERLFSVIEEGSLLNTLKLSEAEDKLLTPYAFITLKPVIAVVNVDEDEMGNEVWPELEARLARRGITPVTLSAAFEREVSSLAAEEQMEFLQAVDLTAPASHRLVHSVYRAMSLISFFTVGEDEVRSWPVRTHSPAPVAGGKIHTDIRRGFIRAEVVSYDHFMDAGSLATARKTGRLRTEGKEYVVVDGDIMNFLFNV
jgi:ribosome-binding ATPase YchF (GTP1/OBG family)